MKMNRIFSSKFINTIFIIAIFGLHDLKAMEPPSEETATGCHDSVTLNRTLRMSDIEAEQTLRLNRRSEQGSFFFANRRTQWQLDMVSDSEPVSAPIRPIISELHASCLTGELANGPCSELIKKYQKKMDTENAMLIWYHKLEKNEVEAIADALKLNRTLKSLIFEAIANNAANIDINRALPLAKVLETNESLQKLDLKYGNIGDEGSIAFAKALESNSTLKILELHRNQIGSEGAQALARALVSNSTLIKLDLQNNNIDDEGASALENALASNCRVRELGLFGNLKISKDLKNLIEQKLARNKKIFLLWEKNKKWSPSLLLPYQSSSFGILALDVKLIILQNFYDLHELILGFELR